MIRLGFHRFIKMPFTADSFLPAIVFLNRTGHPSKDREMVKWLFGRI
jgi:hypothetical protein